MEHVGADAHFLRHTCNSISACEWLVPRSGGLSLEKSSTIFGIWALYSKIFHIPAYFNYSIFQIFAILLYYYYYQLYQLGTGGRSIFRSDSSIFLEIFIIEATGFISNEVFSPSWTIMQFFWTLLNK